jgi:hypothetical protein
MGPLFLLAIDPHRLHTSTLRSQHIQVRIVANVQHFLWQYA